MADKPKPAPAGMPTSPTSSPEPDPEKVQQPAVLSVEKLTAIQEANRAAEKAIVAEEKAVAAADLATELFEEAEDVDQPRARRCPKCGDRMNKHSNPANPHTYGAWHCDTCGICWRGNQPRT